MKSSSFLNLKVVLITKNKNKIDVTDSVDGFYLKHEKNYPIPQMSLQFSMNTAKMADYGIGFFEEKYEITLDIFDNSRKHVIDTLKISAEPTQYPNLDLTLLSRMLDTSGPNTNSNTITFNVIIINNYVKSLFHRRAYLWENPVKYKEIFNKLKSTITGWNFSEIDKPDLENHKFKHFFIPYGRYIDIIPYVMNQGFFTGYNSATFQITHSGMRLYHIKGAKKRKSISTTIYPNSTQVKDFEGIFVTNFKIDRDPSIKLKNGTSVYSLGIGTKRGDTVFKFSNIKTKHPAFAPGLFDGFEGQMIEYHNLGVGNNIVNNSFLQGLTDVIKLQVSITRWQEFEMVVPLRHIYKINFSSKILKRYSGKYIVNSSELIVKRQKQEFVPVVNLDLRMLTEDAYQIN